VKSIDANGRKVNPFYTPRLPYNPDDYPLPPVRDIGPTIAAIWWVERSGLCRDDKTYLMILLTRMDPENPSGVFEFTQMGREMCVSPTRVKAAQQRLWKAGFVTFSRRENVPSPVTLNLADLGRLLEGK